MTTGDPVVNERRLDGLEQRLDGLEQRVTRLTDDLVEVQRRLDAVELDLERRP